MTIDREPKNGDFARYIESLNRQSPGSSTRPAEAASRPSASTSHTTGNLSDAPWGKSPVPSNHLPEWTPDAKPQAAPAPELNMAARASRRLLSTVFTIVAIGLLLPALRALMELINGSLEPGGLGPTALSTIIALSLFRRAKKMRAELNQPLRTLPPLATSPYDKAPPQ